MVIQELAVAPMELPVKKPRTKQIKYDFIENHVREHVNYDDFEAHAQPTQDSTPAIEKIRKKKAKKHTKSTEENIDDITSPTVENILQNDVTEVSQSDLDELRSVYKKCKDVLNRIETKYGHLLDIHKPRLSKHKNLERTEDSSSSDTECTCGGNKKIIFDEDGQEIIKETNLDNHICPKRSKITAKKHVSKNVNIEYEDISLPNDVLSLASILKNPDIDITYRNKVINHMRMLKQDLINEIRFHRPALIDQVKSKSEDVLEFKGSNLLSLPGYPECKKH